MLGERRAYSALEEEKPEDEKLAEELRGLGLLRYEPPDSLSQNSDVEPAEAWSETVDFLKNVRTRSKTGMETPALEAEVEEKSKELNDDTRMKLTSLQKELKTSKRTAGGSRRREAGERGSYALTADA